MCISDADDDDKALWINIFSWSLEGGWLQDRKMAEMEIKEEMDITEEMDIKEENIDIKEEDIEFSCRSSSKFFT